MKYVYIWCIIIKQKVLRIWLVGRKRGVHLIMYLISVKNLTDPQPDVYLTVMMLIVQLTSLIIDFIGSMLRKHLYKYNTYLLMTYNISYWQSYMLTVYIMGSLYVRCNDSYKQMSCTRRIYVKQTSIQTSTFKLVNFRLFVRCNDS